MRFLTATTTIYPYVANANAAIQTNTQNPIGMPTAADYAKVKIIGSNGV